MPIVEKHEQGSFCWAELATSDAASAKSFYTGVFGWESNEVPIAADSTYITFAVKGLPVGAMYAEKSQPPHWTPYFAVESAEAAAQKAAELGGKVLGGPFDVSEHGRMASLEDPTGATFAVWQARNNIGSRLLFEPGTPSWPELATRNTAVAKTFYSGLLGWGAKESPQYTEWTVQGNSMGGMMAMDENWGELPSHWMIYVTVADCDATAAKSTELGGRTCVPPTDIPNVGRFSVLTDPQGAYFSIISMARD